LAPLALALELAATWEVTMRKVGRVLLLFFAILALLVFIGPLIVPIPALENTVPPKELADPDSKFIAVNGLDVHYKEMGDGHPALLLLHGFAASTFSWREVMEPLAQAQRVIAFDRPAFGLTERPMPGEWQGQNPYSADAASDLTVELMDELGIEQGVLVGNSAGGAIALYTALRYPERVKALILVDPAVYSGGGSPGWLRPLLTSPQARRIGPLIARAIRDWGYQFGQSAWHDPGKFTDEIWRGFTRPLQVDNWDRALWELTRASRPLNLSERLDELSLPVLVITGDDDRIVPTEQSIRLAGEIDGAELVVIPSCGHVPHEECPDAFLAAVEQFLASLD
jgi:pimeloyl-ACP methyl ester carboxylesterase